MSDRVLNHFLDAHGRLHTIPSKHGKLLVVLDFLAQRFEPGLKYPEARVNEILGEFHPDYAALSRHRARPSRVRTGTATSWSTSSSSGAPSPTST
jgi:hypothetical protein